MTATQTTNRSWSVWSTLFFIVLLVLMFLAGLLFTEGLWSWIVVVILLIVTVMFIGRLKNGLFHGLIIDERNKISLSRLQIVCWTVLILSAFITAGTGNMRTYLDVNQDMKASHALESVPDKNFYTALEDRIGKEEASALVELFGEEKADEILDDEGQAAESQTGEGQTIGEIRFLDAFANALSIAIPSELWLLMGISTTTLIGTPLIRSNKTKKTSGDESIETVVENVAAIEAQAERQGVSPSDVAVEGEVLVNKDPAQARFGDLFETEYVGNVSQLDIAKVQNFYFTAILVLSYAALLATTFNSISVITEMPALSSSVLALLGISSAGYLAGKAVPSNISAKTVQSGSGRVPLIGVSESIAPGEEGARIVNVQAEKFQNGLLVTVVRSGGEEGGLPEAAKLVGEVQTGSFFFRFDPAGGEGNWEIEVQKPDGK